MRPLILFLDGSSLALSIRDFDSRTNDFVVKHYKIRKMDNGSYFIAVKRTFVNIVELVKHYKGLSSLDFLEFLQYDAVEYCLYHVKSSDVIRCHKSMLLSGVVYSWLEY